MGLLYMIRHGQASFGRENYDKLSETGIRQAVILGEYLVETALRFDAVYAWKLERQTGTAREVIGAYRERNLPIPDYVLSEALNEYDSRTVLKAYIPGLVEEDPSLVGDLEALYNDRKAFQRIFEAVLLRWVRREHVKVKIPHWDSFSSGVYEGVKEILAHEGRGKTIALFTSGGPISAMLQKSLSLSNEETIRLSWQIVNTSVTRFMYDDKRITLAGFNVISHLELQRDPALITYR